MRDTFKRKGARFNGIEMTRSGWRESFAWGGRQFAWEVTGRFNNWFLSLRVDLPVADIPQEIKGPIVRGGKLVTPPKVGQWFKQVREAIERENAEAVVKTGGAPMDPLRRKLIRLAHEDPSLRPHLLPLLAPKTANLDYEGIDYEPIPETKDAFNTILKDLQRARDLKNFKITKPGYKSSDPVMEDDEDEPWYEWFGIVSFEVNGEPISLDLQVNCRWSEKNDAWFRSYYAVINDPLTRKYREVEIYPNSERDTDPRTFTKLLLKELTR